MGEESYDRKQFAQAERAYANAKAKNPSHELAEKATYKLGWANYQLKDYADALIAVPRAAGGIPPRAARRRCDIHAGRMPV